jgi:hypothetical protein
MSSERKAKISDFGLSRMTENSTYYRAKGAGQLPVRWTAPEALEDQKFTSESDVWSFGVLLYEIWTNGGFPYGDMSNQKVWTAVVGGYRLPSPPGCLEDVYKIMQYCWDTDPSERPSFKDLCDFFDYLYYEGDRGASPKHSYTSMSSPRSSDDYAEFVSGSVRERSSTFIPPLASESQRSTPSRSRTMTRRAHALITKHEKRRSTIVAISEEDHRHLRMLAESRDTMYDNDDVSQSHSETTIPTQGYLSMVAEESMVNKEPPSSQEALIYTDATLLSPAESNLSDDALRDVQTLTRPIVQPSTIAKKNRTRLSVAFNQRIDEEAPADASDDQRGTEDDTRVNEASVLQSESSDCDEASSTQRKKPIAPGSINHQISTSIGDASAQNTLPIDRVSVPAVGVTCGAAPDDPSSVMETAPSHRDEHAQANMSKSSTDNPHTHNGTEAQRNGDLGDGHPEWLGARDPDHTTIDIDNTSFPARQEVPSAATLNAWSGGPTHVLLNESLTQTSDI